MTGNGPSLPAARADSSSRGPIYIPLDQVAAACGIDAHELHLRCKPLHWGVPKHWKMVRNVALYNEAVLPELITELHVLRRVEAAQRLAQWLADFTASNQHPDAGEAAPTAPGEKAPWYRQGDLA